MMRTHILRGLVASTLRISIDHEYRSELAAALSLFMPAFGQIRTLTY